MTRPKALVTVAVAALILAGVASWAIYDYLNKEREKTRIASASKQTILVAAADLPIGTKINETQVKTMGWPKESVPPGILTNAADVPGRVSIRHISAGEPLTEQKLSPRQGAPAAGVMSYVVQVGHRAVTVGVNEVAGVAGFLNPNSRVDIVLTTVPLGAREPISKIVLQNVPILAIGQIMEQKDGKPVVVPTVTLDLVPDDAEKLILAAAKGSLQMLLRNIADTDIVDARGATVTKVLAGDSLKQAPATEGTRIVRVAKRVTKPAAVKPAAPSAPSTPRVILVEVIKGSTRKTEKFESQ